MICRFELKSILLFAALAGGTLFADVLVDEVSVRCHNGTFVGVCEKETGIRVFKGIPCAVQPTGELRWKRVPFAERYSAAQKGNGRATYMYRFAQGVRIPVMPWLGTCHGADIPYAFGNASPGQHGTPDAALVARFSAAFAQFARTGNPNAEGRADWVSYGVVARRTRVVGPGDALVRKDDPYGEVINLLMPGYDRIQKARASAVRRRPFRIKGERRKGNERTD